MPADPGFNDRISPPSHLHLSDSLFFSPPEALDDKHSGIIESEVLCMSLVDFLICVECVIHASFHSAHPLLLLLDVTLLLSLSSKTRQRPP